MLIRALPPGCRGPLAAAARRRALEDGECAYRFGDPSEGLFHVAGGEIWLISHSKAGRRLVHLSVPTGRWFGGLSTLDGGPQPHDAVAVGRTLVLHIPLRDIHDVAADAPQLYRSIALTDLSASAGGNRPYRFHAGPQHPGAIGPCLDEHGRGWAGWTAGANQSGGLGSPCRGDPPKPDSSLAGSGAGGLIRTAYKRIDILDHAGLAALGDGTGPE